MTSPPDRCKILLVLASVLFLDRFRRVGRSGFALKTEERDDDNNDAVAEVTKMLILHDPLCAEYGSVMRPEQPARVTRTVEHLRTAHPSWDWRVPPAAPEELLLLAHTPNHLQRLVEPIDFGDDPITSMTLEMSHFAILGRWLSETHLRAAAILEGGYSPDLPLLIDGFLSAWKK